MKHIDQFICLPYDDIFNDDRIKTYIQPKLPTREFEKNKIEYSIPDLRLLNETAIKVFYDILQYVILTPDVDEITFQIKKNTDDKLIRIIMDILLGIQYSYKKKGRNGYSGSSPFLATCIYRIDNMLKIDIVKDHARIIYEYAHPKAEKGETINFEELIIELVEKDHQEFIEWIKKQEEE